MVGSKVPSVGCLKKNVSLICHQPNTGRGRRRTEEGSRAEIKNSHQEARVDLGWCLLGYEGKGG